MKRNNVFKVQSVNGQNVLVPMHSQQLLEPKKKPLELIFENLKILSEVDTTSNKFHVRSKCYSDFDSFFTEFGSTIGQMRMKKKDMDIIFVLCEKLIVSHESLYTDLSNHYDPKEALGKSTEYIRNKLRQKQSIFMRLKELKSNPIFVEPEERVIGLKWTTKVSSGLSLPNHQLKQSTFQYVPILKTLKSLFSRPDFRDTYFKHNVTKHECIPGVYRDFCCGSRFAQCDIFQDPNVIQIQIAVDDFEVVLPLKSKTAKHKINAIYFQVRNMPPEFNSKLDSIFLVSLCNATYFKNEGKSTDEIAKLFLEELKILETEGLTIDSNINLRGTLINTTFDNLGGNSLFGFTECFVATYYCRLCELSCTECKHTFKEDHSKMRTNQSYERAVKYVQSTKGKVDLKISKGIKRYCPFNNLQYYNIFKNPSVDLMHDINECIIPVFIRNFFELAIRLKVLSLADIQRMVRDFNYGFLSKRDKPSLINLDRPNLNQNAAQQYCLMTHLPFILSGKYDQLKESWETMIGLLRIMEVLYSKNITESDIIQLEVEIENHLSDMTNKFNVSIHPKHHFLTHYPNVIRRMGPVVRNWMMRFEARHKKFTDVGKDTNNFINIAATLAKENQIQHCNTAKLIRNNYTASKKSKLYSERPRVEGLEVNLLNDLLSNNCRVFDFIDYSQFQYRKGLVVISNGIFLDIIYVLLVKEEFYLLCRPLEIISFVPIYNSFEVSKNENYEPVLLKISEMQNKQSFDKIICNAKTFILVTTLETHSIIK